MMSSDEQREHREAIGCACILALWSILFWGYWYLTPA